MGKHRKRNTRRAYLTTALVAGSVLCGGIGTVLAQSPPAPVSVSLADPVLGEEIAPPAASQLVPEPSRIYVAKDGDTLWSVAVSQCRSGNSWKSLAKANHLSFPYPVHPGQKITVVCA